MNQNSLITLRIITCCKCKRELYKELKSNNNTTLASYYRDYARILSRFIIEAKITENDQLILNSHNKVKTTWGIINTESGKNKKRSETQALNVEGKKITDQQTIAATFNEYFITIAEKVERQIKNNFINDGSDIMVSHTRFMEQAFTNPCPSMKWKCTTTEEIERIIKSLKTKNSYGYEISTKILKVSCPFISSPINYISNKILFWDV